MLINEKKRVSGMNISKKRRAFWKGQKEGNGIIHMRFFCALGNREFYSNIRNWIHQKEKKGAKGKGIQPKRIATYQGFIMDCFSPVSSAEKKGRSPVPIA